MTHSPKLVLAGPPRDPDGPLAESLTLAAQGPGRYRGQPGRYSWNWVYGGRLVAQMVAAAGEADGDEAAVSAIHSVFLRPGRLDQPLDHSVTSLRDGARRSNRSVQVTQGDTTVAAGLVSLDPSPRRRTARHDAMPVVDGPEGLPDSSWSPSFEKRVPPQSGRATRCAWMRPVGDVGSGGKAACALAYMSDDLPARAAVALSGRERTAPVTHDDWVPEGVVSSSLEHSMWFFDEPGVDGWHLFTAEAVALVHSRCLVRGEVFDQDGRIVASVSQLVRVEWEEGS